MTNVQQQASEPSAARPELTEAQQTAVHRAASELVSAAVMGLSGTLANRDLQGAGTQRVLGAFVSLKRQGHLRGCCGWMSEGASLAEAVEKAATRTPTEDVRFPRVSPIELEFLDLEIWILFSPHEVEEKGRDRASQITIGRHGLRIQRGASAGLLLPGVASENEYTAEQFLQQVCLKAGLPPTAWQEDETVLSTFEGIAISRPIEAAPAKPGVTKPVAPFTDEQLERLAKACAENVFALLRGATPNYYMPGCPEGSVSGIAIMVSEPESEEVIEVSRLSLRTPMPLQSSLFTLSQGAAQALHSRGRTAPSIESVNLAVAILHDPALQGTVEEPDLRGMDPRSRALLVIESGKQSWGFDPEATPEKLLEMVSEQIHVTEPKAARLFSLGICSTDSPMSITLVPSANKGPQIRPAHGAGRFYPADESELNTTLDELFDGDAPEPQSWPAIMVPHAGLKYSGKIAADTFRRVTIPETVVVLCPKHTPLGLPWAVAAHDSWSLPGMSIDSDVELAKKLAERIDGLELDDAAHRMEHAVEVQLPLIARLAPETKVVGIAIGGGSLERLQQFATGLAEVLGEQREKTLLVISSDMNHFAADEENRRLDEIAIKALEGLDPAAAMKTIGDQRISMCGLRPAVIVMETLRHWDSLAKSERVGYGTSADVTGDASRVVGYAGMLFG